MGRKRSDSAEGARTIDAIFKQKMAEAKETAGARVYVNGDEESRVFCLDVPFALKLLFQMPGMPLGRFIVVAGLPESCKSALSYEFGRLFRASDGGYSLIETENKDSTSLRKSIVGYDDTRSSLTYTSVLEEWMAALKHQIDFVKSALDDHTPPRSVPWLFIVDSLSGVSSKKIAEDIDETGASKRTFADNANLLNTYSKNMSHWPEDYPISVVGVNHMKLAPDMYGNLTKKTMQGGYALRFHASVEVNTKAEGRQDVRKEPVHENFKRIKLSVGKNSLAPHSPDLFVDFVWRFVPVNPEDPNSKIVQRSFFDWGSCAIEYLLKLDDCPASVKSRVRDIIDLKATRRDRMICSEALGIPEGEPVSYRKAGLMLDRRPDIQEKLFTCLGIRSAFVFEKGKDMLVQKKEAVDKIIRLPGDITNFTEMTEDF